MEGRRVRKGGTDGEQVATVRTGVPSRRGPSETV